MSFSERHGLARAIQRQSMDDRLRAAIWNAFLSFRKRDVAWLPPSTPGTLTRYESVLEWIWMEFLSEPRDVLGSMAMPWLDAEDEVRTRFFEAPWNVVYDFVEFIATAKDKQFSDACNRALLRERSAYRLVHGRVVEIVDDAQLAAIDVAFAATEPFSPVHQHLRTALDRLADRPDPDCRNAAKEAISAVETLVGMIAGSPGATLDAGLKLIESRRLLPLHPSLIKSWSALYGYTSDAGIRHGMKDGQPSVGLDEAVYVVVSCSAMVSYLISLAARASVSIQ